MAKLRWVEIDGMKYVGEYEDDYDHCSKCVFYRGNLEDYCAKISYCANLVFVPLEPQHIPNLRKRGKTKWLS
jgi:hypothetical protein